MRRERGKPQATGAALARELGRRSPAWLFFSNANPRGRQPVRLVLVFRRSSPPSTSALRSLVTPGRVVRVGRFGGRLGRRALLYRHLLRVRCLVPWWRLARGLPSLNRRRRRWIVARGRRLLLLLPGSAGLVRVWLRCKRLTVRAIQRCARRDASWNGRDGDEGRRTGRRDRLEHTLLVHASAVLALASRGALVAAAADLRQG
jgi:hypothetical protein